MSRPGGSGLSRHTPSGTHLDLFQGEDSGWLAHAARVEKGASQSYLPTYFGQRAPPSTLVQVVRWVSSTISAAPSRVAVAPVTTAQMQVPPPLLACCSAFAAAPALLLVSSKSVGHASVFDPWSQPPGLNIEAAARLGPSSLSFSLVWLLPRSSCASTGGTSSFDRGVWGKRGTACDDRPWICVARNRESVVGCCGGRSCVVWGDTERLSERRGRSFASSCTIQVTISTFDIVHRMSLIVVRVRWLHTIHPYIRTDNKVLMDPEQSSRG